MGGARGQSSGARGEGAVRFAEVALPASVAQGMEVRLPDGTILRGGRVGELAALVRALRG
jgi:hypothetical protein